MNCKIDPKLLGTNCPIIFLDIDGVLNTTCWDLYQKKMTEASKIYKKHCIEKFGEGTRTTFELTHISDVALVVLKEIVERLDAKVVISSTWREGRSPEHFQWLFEERGFPLPEATVIGCTPVMDGIDRGFEIKAWIEQNEFKGKYIILDDDHKGFFPGQCLFPLDFKAGLTPPDVVKVCLTILRHFG